MKNIKSFLSTPYPYIFLLSYLGIWTIWDRIKLPFSNPAEVISFLPSIGYNPSNNLLRFALAVLIPPLACFAYWLITRHQVTLQERFNQSRSMRYILGGGLLAICVGIAISMGILQSSTNPANNQPTTYGGPYTHAMVDTFHEGETLGPAISYSDPAKVPYRDFVVVHGVFQDAVRTVIAFKLFGKTIGASRVMATLLTISAFVLLFVLLLVLFKGNIIRSAVGLVAFAVLILPTGIIPSVNDYLLGVQLPFRDIATMLFLIFATLGARYYLDRNYRHAGIMTGVVGFIAIAGFANSLDRAFYILSLSAIWLGMLFIMEPGRAYLKNVLLWFASGGIVGTAVLLWALKGHFGDFWQYIVDITKYKEFLDGIAFTQPGPQITILLLAISAGIAGIIFWTAQQFTTPNVAKQPTASAKIKAFWPSLQKVVREHHTLILLAIVAIFFMRSALGRALIDHFIYSVQWLYLFVIYAVLAYASPFRKKISLGFGFLAVTALLLTAALYGSIVKRLDIRADVFPIHVTDQQIVRKDYLETADYLKENLTGDETFATLTSEGIWYYLADQPSPLQYPIIWYAFTKQERMQLAHSLESNKNIKYLVTNDNWTSNIDYISNQQRFPEVYKILHEQYVPKVGFGAQTVWIKK